MLGRRKDQRTSLEHMRERVRIIFRLRRQFGESDVAGCVHEFTELAVGDRRPVDPEPLDGDAMAGRFLRIMSVGTHAIGTARHVQHPSSASASDDGARSDNDFASAKLILNSNSVASGFRPFTRDTAEALFRPLCSFGSKAVGGDRRPNVDDRRRTAVPPLVTGRRQPQLFQRLFDRERTGPLARRNCTKLARCCPTIACAGTTTKACSMNHRT